MATRECVNIAGVEKCIYPLTDRCTYRSVNGDFLEGTCVNNYCLPSPLAPRPFSPFICTLPFPDVTRP